MKPVLKLRTYGKRLLDLLYPEDLPPGVCRRVEFPFCRLCGEPHAGQIDGEYVCSNCAGRRWYLSRARAALRAEADVLEWIHALKYRKHWHCIPRLTDWLEEGYRRFYSDQAIDGLVPVPLHWMRLRRRGFNQSFELARQLSRRTKIPVRHVLKRVKATRVQASLDRRQRLANCSQAFAVKKWAFDVQGKHLLIIDDVFTTGSTANGCARALKSAGAASCQVLTVARGGNF